MDIKDLFRDECSLTPREVADLIVELPPTARVARWLAKTQGEFNTDQHLMATIIDILADISFNASISASSAAGKEYKTIIKKGPKPMKRPEDPRKKVEAKRTIRFMTGKELTGKLGGQVSTNRRARNHTPECTRTQTTGASATRCGCPRIAT